jgi:hypothetical protein
MIRFISSVQINWRARAYIHTSARARVDSILCANQVKILYTHLAFVVFLRTYFWYLLTSIRTPCSKTPSLTNSETPKKAQNKTLRVKDESVLIFGTAGINRLTYITRYPHVLTLLVYKILELKRDLRIFCLYFPTVIISYRCRKRPTCEYFGCTDVSSSSNPLCRLRLPLNSGIAKFCNINQKHNMPLRMISFFEKAL